MWSMPSALATPLAVRSLKTLFHLTLTEVTLTGHIVSGHVDGTALVTLVRERPDKSKDLWIDLSSFQSQSIFVIYKGSICLDGI